MYHVLQSFCKIKWHFIIFYLIKYVQGRYVLIHQKYVLNMIISLITKYIIKNITREQATIVYFSSYSIHIGTTVPRPQPWVHRYVTRSVDITQITITYSESREFKNSLQKQTFLTLKTSQNSRSQQRLKYLFI